MSPLRQIALLLLLTAAAHPAKSEDKFPDVGKTYSVTYGAKTPGPLQFMVLKSAGGSWYLVEYDVFAPTMPRVVRRRPINTDASPAPTPEPTPSPEPTPTPEKRQMWINFDWVLSATEEKKSE